jgi:hypothetical protein
MLTEGREGDIDSGKGFKGLRDRVVRQAIGKNPNDRAQMPNLEL